MNRIDAIEALLKEASRSNEWQEAAALSAIDAIVGCEEGRITSALVKSLIRFADNEDIDTWMDENNVRTPQNEDGTPANRLPLPSKSFARGRVTWSP